MAFQKTVELLKQLIASKQNLVSALVDKGEEASVNDPFDSLVEKASNYVPRTMIFVDENGMEVAGALVDEEVVIDATVNDVREGKIFVSDAGVKTGEKFIPAYVVSEGYRLITKGNRFILPTNSHHDYTKLQAIICPFNTSPSKSVSAEKVVINDNVYNVLTSVPITSVVKDSANLLVDLGIVNDTTQPYYIRFFMYKEIY